MTYSRFAVCLSLACCVVLYHSRCELLFSLFWSLSTTPLHRMPRKCLGLCFSVKCIIICALALSMANCAFMHDPANKVPTFHPADSHARTADTIRQSLRFVSRGREGNFNNFCGKRGHPSTVLKVALDNEEQSTPLSPLKIPPVPKLAPCDGSGFCRGNC